MRLDETEHVLLLAAQQVLVVNNGLCPVHRFEHIHEPCVLPSFGRHEAGHRRMGELPGIAFLGNEIAELRVFRINVLKEHPKGVADVPVVFQLKFTGCLAHNETVVADHILRLTPFLLDCLLQLRLDHLRVPALSCLHPHYTHVSLPETMARMLGG